MTRNGIIKKSQLKDYNLKRNTAMSALRLDVNDEIISILITEDDRIGILSHDGQFIMVETAPIRSLGRIARGIIGIKLATSDYVVSARIIPTSTYAIFSITPDGYGKSTDINDFSVTKTNTKGVKIQKADELCDFIALTSHSDILINSQSTQIRVKESDIPMSARGTIGTKLIKLVNNTVIGISSL